MNYRIPPAVYWLVTTRRHVAGQLAQAERRIERFGTQILLIEQAAAAEVIRLAPMMSRLRADLSSIDATIRMHDIGIDPEDLTPIRVQTNLVAKPMAKGSFTRSIFASLREEPHRWRTTTEIASVVASMCHPNLSDAEFSQYRYHVRKRLQALVRTGKVDRLAGRVYHQEGRYRLGDQDGYSWLTDSEAQQSDALLGSSLERSGSAQLGLFDAADHRKSA